MVALKLQAAGLLVSTENFFLQAIVFMFEYYPHPLLLPGVFTVTVRGASGGRCLVGCSEDGAWGCKDG
jgi:hypothetical protein